MKNRGGTVIDVCICTHNPRRDIFSLVLNSLVHQSAGKEEFRVLVVDNASIPPISDSRLEVLRKAGVEARLVREPLTGISRARLRAASETDGNWILFVDDDNELSSNYLSEGLIFICQYPEVGCFGGRLLLAENLKPQRWAIPFLPYLGIKDIGDEILIGKSECWGQWEPPTAGAFICRPLLEEYRKQAMVGLDVHKLGRRGRNDLASCEDSLIMRNAFRLNLSNAYNPKLVLHHHLDPRRFSFSYLIKLLRGYGVSHVILESILRGRQSVPTYYASVQAFMKTLLWVFLSERKKSLAFALGQVAYHIGAYQEHLKQNSTHD